MMTVQHSSEDREGVDDTLALTVVMVSLMSRTAYHGGDGGDDVDGDFTVLMAIWQGW